MSDAKTCARCGATTNATDRLSGLCAACLLRAGIESKEDARSSAGERRPAPPIEELAPHFPELEILELVGQGGMGSVYRVRQRALGREAALKVLALDADSAPAFGERFAREAQALASLTHPNIVSIFDFGHAGPWWYFLMEYVDGASLRQMIRAREIDPRAALAIVAQVCDALQCAHDHGVVHRDVKPENVLVTRKGVVKILDFGLAKLMKREPRSEALTDTGQVMGTLRYMAPEQWERPLTVDHRADIFSVGVVFYELLTGELPVGRFPLPSAKPGVDARLDEVVLKSLEKEPDRRYQHASEVRTDVRRIESGPAPIPEAASTDRARPKGRFGAGWIALGCAALATVSLAGAVLVYWAWGASRSVDLARQAAAQERGLPSSTTRVSGRCTRSSQDEATGFTPRLDRDRARALGWTEHQILVGDAIADLAWAMHVSFAHPGGVQRAADGAAQYRIEPFAEQLELHRLLLETLVNSPKVSLALRTVNGARELEGYVFAGPGYEAALDATSVLSWSVDSGALLVSASGQTPWNAGPDSLPPAATLDQLLDLAGLAERLEFGREPWVVTIYDAPVPHGWYERGGQRVELDAEALRTRYKLLASLAEFAPK